ncbi:MAG TPA: immunoglobulin domain-containing protein, partial [Candidatus Acidoferrum sp.]
MIRWALASVAVLLALLNSGCAGVVSGSNNSPAPVAPSIATQPASQTITSGQTATFSVTATGTAPLTYQWKRNSVVISGASASTYTTPATNSSDNGAQFNVTVSNSAGSATSSSASLTVATVATAPSITTQPTSQTLVVGQTASFSVVATGTAPLSYQWKKNGVAVSGAISSSYTTPATATSDSGAQFTVVVGNTAGSVTSSAATLTVTASAVAPSITTQPTSQSVTAGQTAPFSVSATGTAPLSYQWKKNGVAVSGAISSSYTTPATATSDSGAQFTVVVGNTAGSVTSSAATLTVTASAVAPSITTQPTSQSVTA